MEAFRRECQIRSGDGRPTPLHIHFHLPEPDPHCGGYRAHARIDCAFFQRDLRGTGQDAAQAFFALPGAVVSYLLGKRREGYEAYWFEQGDLDYANFWTYTN